MRSINQEIARRNLMAVSQAQTAALAIGIGVSDAEMMRKIY